ERLRPDRADMTSITADRAVPEHDARKWLAVGLSTEPADRSRAEAGVAAAYRAARLTPPCHLLWLASPLAGLEVACSLRAELSVGTRLHGRLLECAELTLKNRLGWPRYHELRQEFVAWLRTELWNGLVIPLSL